MRPKQPPEFDAFTKLVDQVLAVPHSVIQRRVEEHREQADKNPQKRGPKPKSKKSSASSRGGDGGRA
jgi:hypothetical protein